MLRKNLGVFSLITIYSAVRFSFFNPQSKNCPLPNVSFAIKPPITIDTREPNDTAISYLCRTHLKDTMSLSRRDTASGRWEGAFFATDTCAALRSLAPPVIC